MGKGGDGVVWFRVCEAPLNDWANGVLFLLITFTRMVSMNSVLREVGPILTNGYGI